MLFCGIDTSNYTTSAALCDGEGNIVCSLKLPLAVGGGELGLRQSDAVFAHVKNLPIIMERLGEQIGGRPVAAVGVSSSPRNVPDSYMPCFLPGVSAAFAFASGRGIPVYQFSHQQGHVMAALATSGCPGDTGGRPFLALHVSGGTTDLLYLPSGVLDGISVIGGSSDLHAGQAVDRIGVKLGLGFPCGPEMEKLALSFTGGIRRRRPSAGGTFCSLSGLENLAGRMIADGAGAPEVCAFVFAYIADTLLSLIRGAREAYGPLPVVLCGGVAENACVRRDLSAESGIFFAGRGYSADNAAGTALLCRRLHIQNAR
jgi:N6-L-threonylcarbamoyladenine synthase